MKAITYLIGFIVMTLLAAAVALSLAWLIALAIRQMWSVDTFQSLVLSLAVLGILLLFIQAVALKTVGGLSESLRAAFWTTELKEEKLGELPEAHWLAPCPCGQGTPFAQCCGKRAFKRRHSREA
jgi:hypothetical protein